MIVKNQSSLNREMALEKKRLKRGGIEGRNAVKKNMKKREAPDIIVSQSKKRIMKKKCQVVKKRGGIKWKCKSDQEREIKSARRER